MGKNKGHADVLDALYVCFINNEPIPSWLAEAFVAQYQKGAHGEVRSWDKAFGPPARFGSSKKIERRIKQQRAVVAEVGRLKAEGKSLNEGEFEAIGSRLGVGGKTFSKSVHNLTMPLLG